MSRGNLSRRDIGIGALGLGLAALLGPNTSDAAGPVFGELKALAADAREEAAYVLGLESYVYGFPLVLMDVTNGVLTATSKSEQYKAPFNQFLRHAHLRGSGLEGRRSDQRKLSVVRCCLRSGKRAARRILPGNQEPLFCPSADEQLDRRLRVHRHSDRQYGGGQFPDRGPELGWNAAGRRQGGLPVFHALRMDSGPDGGKQPRRLSRDQRASGQAADHTGEFLGDALYPAGQRSGESRR